MLGDNIGEGEVM